MSAAIPTVYLSSTKEDLTEYRAAVLQQIASMTLHGVSMEVATADERPPLESCIDGVKRSDVYVGIFAHRYGFVPPDQTQSITELEYRAAGEAGIDRLIFLLHEAHPWKPGDSDAHTGEHDHGLRIQRLCNELRLLKTVQFFTTPEDLARKVAAALHVWTQKTQQAQLAQATLAGAVSAALRSYLEDCVSREQELDRKYIFLSGTGERPVLPPSGFPLHLVPRSFRVIGTTRQPEKEVDHVPSISDVLERYPQVVIIGDPGSGKSTTLHYLHLVKAQQALDGTGPVPLYVNLAEWPDSVPDLKSLLVHERDLKGCPSIPASRLLLLLDGLNEMRERDYDARVESVQRWLVENQGAQVVVAARKRQYVQNRQLRTAMVTIHPLTDSQVELFVAKYLGAEDAAGLLANIRWETRQNADARHFARLADNPFQLALLCYVYSQSGKMLPSTRGELLRILAQTVYQREADLGNHLGLTYDDMQAGLGELALAAVQARTATAIDGAWAARRIPNGIDIDRLRRLGVDTGLIRLSKNDRFIQFSHQLILEYFAAERLSNDLKRVSAVVRKPRFQHGERRAEFTDEVCFTLAELHGNLGAALNAIGDVDPIIAVDALSDNPQSGSVTTESKATLAQKLVGPFSAYGERARSAVITRLGVLGDAALNPLATVLREGSKPERRMAVQALAAINSLDAVDELIAGLHDRDRWVRRETRDALRELAEIHPDLMAGFIRKRSAADPAGAHELQALLAPPRDEPVRESWDREVVERVTKAGMTVVCPDPAPAETTVAPPPARFPLPERPTDIPGMLERAARTVEVWRAATERLMVRYHEKPAPPDIATLKLLDRDLSTEDLLDELKVASRWRSMHIIKVLAFRGNEALSAVLDFLSSTPYRSVREDALSMFAKYHVALDADALEHLLCSRLSLIRQGALPWLLHADGVRGFHELLRRLVRDDTPDTTHAIPILIHLIEQVEEKPPTAIYPRVVRPNQRLVVRDALGVKRWEVEARLRSILVDPGTVNMATLRDKTAIALYLLLENEIVRDGEPASITIMTEPS